MISKKTLGDEPLTDLSFHFCLLIDKQFSQALGMILEVSLVRKLFVLLALLSLSSHGLLLLLERGLFMRKTSLSAMSPIT